MGGSLAFVLLAVALCVSLVVADECDRHLSDCGQCLETAGCGWCTVGGFKFCVDKSSGFCREDEWATTCDANHRKVTRLQGDKAACAALEAVKTCKSIALIDCNARVSTDCVVCVLTAEDATCEAFVDTIRGTTAPPVPDFQGFRWARQGLPGPGYSYYTTPPPTVYGTPSPTSPYGTPPPTSPYTLPPATSPYTLPPATSPYTLPPATSPYTLPPATSPYTVGPTSAPPTPTTTAPGTPATAAPTTVGPTFTPAPPPPVLFCAARFVGSGASNFIQGFLSALIKIFVTLDNIQDNPATAVQCRSDIATLMLNEFNLWMAVEIAKRGGPDREYHLAVYINFNVFNLDFDVARTSKRQDVIDDVASTFAIANFSDTVVRRFAALFENGGAGLLGPLKGKVTSVTVTAPTDTVGEKKKSDINGGELAAIIAVVSVFICLICVGTGYLLFRRSQLGKTPFAAAQATGPQR